MNKRSTHVYQVFDGETLLKESRYLKIVKKIVDAKENEGKELTIVSKKIED